MNQQFKLEEFAQFVLAFLSTLYFEFDWWLFWALLLTPDIGMLGYAVNTSIGALTYNLFHSKTVAVILVLMGLQLTKDSLLFTGFLLYGHSAMDRIFGYGPKYSDDFKHTHLGHLGKRE